MISSDKLPAEVEKSIIPSLTNSLEWRVQGVECATECALKTANPSKKFSSLIVFQDGIKELDANSLLDTTNSGINLLVITTGQERVLFYLDLYIAGSRLVQKYQSKNIDVALLFWFNLNESHRLIEMASNVILSGKQFSGQILVI